MSENTNKNVPNANTSPSSDEDDEKFVCTSPDMQLHSSKYTADSSTKLDVKTENEVENVFPIPTDGKLAAVEAKYGGYSSGVFSASSDLKSPDASGSVKADKMPFHFPKVTNSARSDFNGNQAQAFERVEIVDNYPSDKSTLLEWPQNYIEKDGFLLGIQPGNFFKSKTERIFYAKLPHRSKYEILLTNNTEVPCDVDLYVSGKLAFPLRLPAGVSRLIDGPKSSEKAFHCFRSKDVPLELGIKEENPRDGMVKAVFTPQKVSNARLRTISLPLSRGISGKEVIDLFDEGDLKGKKRRSYTTSDQENLERSLDMNTVAAARTVLLGLKKRNSFIKAEEMETDLSKRVILQFRIITSLIDEGEVSDEK